MFYHARANVLGRTRVRQLRSAQTGSKSEAVVRKVILTMHMSLDGFIAGPNGELDWTAADEAVDDDLPELLSTSDTALVGRVLYQGFAGYWPTYDITDPSKSKGEIAFANWINEVPKLVFSTTLENAEWKNSRWFV